ncbi:MAG: oligosaccharide flippase family protein [Rubrivivax sp.]|nr:oligosaccharide flippase family protein [Rubrivivax sp.]
MRLAPRTASLIEQGGVSAANLLAFVWLARAMAPEHWGVFGFAYAIVLFAQGFQRALVTIPMIPFSAGADGWAAQRAAWAAANAWLALGGTALLAAAALWMARVQDGWLASSLAMAALLLPLALAHEFARRAAVQERRFALLAALGLAYALPLLVVAVAGTALRAGPGHPAWPAAVALAAAYAASALLYRLRARQPLLPLPPGPLPQARGYPAYAGWALGSHLGYSGYNFGVQALLAALAGPAAVGLFHACRTLVQPVTVLQSAMDGIDKPRAAAAWATMGKPALRRVLWRSFGWMAVPSLPFLALVALAAPPLLGWLYGPAYAGAHAVVVAWCAVAACSLVSQPVESGLYVARRPRELFFARAAAALCSLAAALPLVQALGAVGALLAMALGFALAAGFGSLALYRLPPLP